MSTCRTASSAFAGPTLRTSPGSGRSRAWLLGRNARLLGGNISVSSDVERGSVFRLMPPLHPAGDVSEL
jgi:hypothetical protein